MPDVKFESKLEEEIPPNPTMSSEPVNEEARTAEVVPMRLPTRSPPPAPSPEIPPLLPEQPTAGETTQPEIQTAGEITQPETQTAAEGPPSLKEIPDDASSVSSGVDFELPGYEPTIEICEWEYWKSMVKGYNPDIRVLSGPARYMSNERRSANPDVAKSTINMTSHVPERIRLGSPEVRSFLEDLSPNRDWDEIAVLLSPYKVLIANEDYIRRECADLDKKLGSPSRLKPVVKHAKDIYSPVPKDQLAKRRASMDPHAPFKAPSRTGTMEERLTAYNVGATSAPADRTTTNNTEMLDGIHESPTVTESSSKTMAAILLDQGANEQSPADSADGYGETSAEPTGTRVVDGKSTEKPDFSKEERLLGGLRCLLQVMDQLILPTYHRIQNASATDKTTPMISFQDLWYLYPAGTNLFARLGGSDLVDPEDEFVRVRDRDRDRDRYEYRRERSARNRGPPRVRASKVYQTGWRCLLRYGGRVPLDGSGVTDESMHSLNEKKASPTNFTIHCYHLDFDGAKVGPVFKQFRIQPYEGERPISSLTVFPCRFSKKYDAEMERLSELGRAFQSYNLGTSKHFVYSGPTLDRSPDGATCGIPSDTPKRRAHLRSEVIVDTQAALEAHPTWQEPLEASVPRVRDTVEYEDDHETTEYYDLALNRRRMSNREYVINDSDVEVDMAKRFRSRNGILKHYTDDPEETDPPELSDVEEKDLFLLPQRLFGFALREREFVTLLLDPERIQPVQKRRDALKDLKLPAEHKAVIESLVQQAFRSMEVTKQTDSTLPEPLSYDLVEGKGNGLIILLHGVPGVGKTSTAECVSMALGTPLMPITCGDLGTTPETVQTNLETKFDQAERWGCILLLDEADVFLAERDNFSIERNALVSVFLRTLEYYNGILFLTTNRVGAFDEAFKSRIHISLYYPNLDKLTTLAIWRMNLQRLKERKKDKLEVNDEDIFDFASTHFDENQKKNTVWNGRQIRNAFQTAAALAEMESLRKASGQNELGVESVGTISLEVKHFSDVAVATRKFDEYMLETKGANDAVRQYLNQYRADHMKFEPMATSPKSNFQPGYQPGRSAGQNQNPQGSTQLQTGSNQGWNSFQSQPFTDGQSMGFSGPPQQFQQQPWQQQFPNFSQFPGQMSGSQSLPAGFQGYNQQMPGFQQMSNMQPQQGYGQQAPSGAQNFNQSGFGQQGYGQQAQNPQQGSFQNQGQQFPQNQQNQQFPQNQNQNQGQQYSQNQGQQFSQAQGQNQNQNQAFPGYTQQAQNPTQSVNQNHGTSQNQGQGQGLGQQFSPQPGQNYVQQPPQQQQPGDPNMQSGAAQ